MNSRTHKNVKLKTDMFWFEFIFEVFLTTQNRLSEHLHDTCSLCLYIKYNSDIFSYNKQNSTVL